jgi:hypothetical protein
MEAEWLLLKEDPVHLNLLVTECTAAEPMTHIGFGSYFFTVEIIV